MKKFLMLLVAGFFLMACSMPAIADPVVVIVKVRTDQQVEVENTPRFVYYGENDSIAILH